MLCYLLDYSFVGLHAQLLVIQISVCMLSFESLNVGYSVYPHYSSFNEIEHVLIYTIVCFHTYFICYATTASE